MIVFAGNQMKGYWLPEVAGDENIIYVKEEYHIEDQINSILKESSCKYVIFDVTQYIDDPEVIATFINRICQSNNSTPIILASGLLPTSNIIVALIEQNIKLFIFASEASQIKDQFIKCINGYYAANEIDIISDLKEKIDSSKKIISNSFLIGIGGIKPGIGTTTQCIQLVKYIQFCGYSVAYIELNDTNYVRQVLNTYEDIEEHDPELGKVTYKSVEMYYKQEKISEILQLGYDYYVYDYGVFNSPDFNKTSFLEKNLKIFVLGCKPNEMPYTQNVIRSLFYQDVTYIFNFTPKDDQEDLLLNMDDKADKTFFSEFSLDPFTYENPEVYKNILPLEIKKDEDVPKKQPFFSKFIKHKKNQ